MTTSSSSIDTADTAISRFLSAWSNAERAGDTGALSELLLDDFAGTGPLGFQLSKQDWLARFGPQGLTYDAFELIDTKIRVYGDAAIVTGREVVRGSHGGNPIPPETQATLLLVRQSGSWRLAGMHLSFVAGTPGAPPMPPMPPRPQAPR